MQKTISKSFNYCWIIQTSRRGRRRRRRRREMTICMCCESRIVPKSIVNPWISPRRTKLGFVAICPSSTTIRRSPATVRASAVDSPESSSNFAKRMEQAWLISQVPANLFSPIYMQFCLTIWSVNFTSIKFIVRSLLLLDVTRNVFNDLFFYFTEATKTRWVFIVQFKGSCRMQMVCGYRILHPRW